MNELISIIVPIYNAEKYLNKCIDSLINQTYSNIEILLIDDGSVDKSGIICDRYKKIDNRIKVYHIKNAGVSAARNLGIKEADGLYIGFIDADDTINKDMYKSLYENIQESKAEISVCGYNMIQLNGSTISYFGTNKKIILDKENAVKNFLDENILGEAVWNKLFKTNIIKDIKFNEKLKINEDKLFCLEAYLKCNKIVYYDVCNYNYSLRENSATTSMFSNKFMDVIIAYNLIEQLCLNINISNKESYLKKMYLVNLLILYRKIVFSRNRKNYQNKEEYIINEIKRINVNKINLKINLFNRIEYKIIRNFNFLYYPLFRVLTNCSFLKNIKKKIKSNSY